MRAIGLLLSVVLSVCAASLHAAIIHVPADQPTIQAGIDAAVEGDTVLVADGTYTGDGNYDIDFLGKAIAVISENGAESCVIDCEGNGRGFFFHNGEDSGSILQGFTIRNAWTPGAGAGIYCVANSSPVITDNVITGNVSSNGGGIACNNSSPTIANNRIVGMSVTYNGGGISCGLNSSPTIEHNTIVGNETGNEGGGIYCENNSTPTITGNIIVGNTSNGWGGGIDCYGASPIITDNTIIGNVAVTGAAGGIGSWNSDDALITGNTIMENSAGGTEYGGGGIACDGGSSIIEDNIISGNSADWGGGIANARGESVIRNNTITYNEGVGGGIGAVYATVTIMNNTIVNNDGLTEGGGICCWDSCMVTVTNTILWDNSAATGDEIWLGYYAEPPMPSVLDISYSDVAGGEGSTFVDEGCTLEWGDGMMDSEPTFVLPEKRDFRLLWESPCIDAGCPDSLDVDGTICDMGACFFNQNDYLTVYVTPDEPVVSQGDRTGITYTLINRWAQPETFWALTQAITPAGGIVNVHGPKRYTVPASHTVQVHMDQNIPMWYPTGMSECWSRIGMPPDSLYDEDRFQFLVIP